MSDWQALAILGVALWVSSLYIFCAVISLFQRDEDRDDE